MAAPKPTFDSPKVAKARLPTPFLIHLLAFSMSFFVPGGDMLIGRLATFSTAAKFYFIHKW
jgi:hypothetical protein